MKKTFLFILFYLISMPLIASSDDFLIVTKDGEKTIYNKTTGREVTEREYNDYLDFEESKGRCKAGDEKCIERAERFYEERRWKSKATPCLTNFMIKKTGKKTILKKNLQTWKK